MEPELRGASAPVPHAASGRPSASPGRAVRVVLGAVAAAHVALFVHAVRAPDAMLRFDRAPGRLRAAEALASARSPDELFAALAAGGTVGDSAWHGAVLAAAGGWLPAVQLVQLALLALAGVALWRTTLALDGRPDVAWLAVALYAVIPIDFMIPHFLGSEAFFSPLLVFGTFGVVRWACGGRATGPLALAGACFGAAALTRGDVLPWLPVAIAGVALLARRRSVSDPGPRAAHPWLQVALFAALVALPPAGWVAFRAAGSGALSYGGDAASIEGNVAIRVRAIRAAAGAPGAGPEEPVPAPFASLVGEARRHPALFAREWLFHAVKLLALPENLDAFRYFDLYAWKGDRSELVHAVGWIPAVRRYVAEMPVAMAWLCVTAILFNALWLAIAFGVVDALRRTDPLRRLLFLGLLSLPLVWVALRALAEGEARKRAPVDFALVVFAAIGIADLRARLAARRARGISASTRGSGGTGPGRAA